MALGAARLFVLYVFALAQALYFFANTFSVTDSICKKIMCLVCVGIHTTQKA